ncbi:MAG: hypothetical protein EXR99_01200 [Gemmataceae bacterium]|nr:hypothetical protein [Gemmataceae bacterium]
MKTTPGGIFLCLFLIPMLVGLEPKKSVQDYALSLENPDGGFLSEKAKEKTSLRATLGAIRISQMEKKSLSSLKAHQKFILSCWKESGEFADTPGGKPDLITTVVGLMACKDANILEEKVRKSGVLYLIENAKNFEEVRMACAFLAQEKEIAQVREAWSGLVLNHLRQTKTQAKPHQLGREMAGALVTLLRLGVAPPMEYGFTGSWRQQDGGFASANSTQSDMDTVYRVGRFLHMTQNQTELRKTLPFIEKCANADGGFGPAPGKPSTMGATYQARIVLLWTHSLQPKSK